MPVPLRPKLHDYWCLTPRVSVTLRVAVRSGVVAEHSCSPLPRKLAPEDVALELGTARLAFANEACRHNASHSGNVVGFNLTDEFSEGC